MRFVKLISWAMWFFVLTGVVVLVLVNRPGYYFVRLYKNELGHNKYAHRLVAVCCLIKLDLVNKNKLNNNAVIVKFVTSRENFMSRTKTSILTTWKYKVLWIHLRNARKSVTNNLRKLRYNLGQISYLLSYKLGQILQTQYN